MRAHGFFEFITLFLQVYCPCLRRLDVQSTTPGSGEVVTRSRHLTPHFTFNPIPVSFPLTPHSIFRLKKIHRVQAMKRTQVASIRPEYLVSENGYGKKYALCVSAAETFRY